MRYRYLFVPVVSLQLWACSDPAAVPSDLDQPTTGAIRALLLPAAFDFMLTVDGSPVQGLFLYEAVIHDLSPGMHEVGLIVNPGECAVTANPRQVRVVAGQLTEAAFPLTCPTGAIVVDVSTTGVNAPATFVAYTEWAKDGWCEWFTCQSYPVTANGSATLQDLWTVPHRVMLMNLPDHCTPSRVEQFVVVATGAPRRVAFNVVCT